MHEVWNSKETIINTFNKFATSSSSLVVTESQAAECIHTTILIPAYDINKNGTVFNLSMNVNLYNPPSINTYGRVATALTNMLERVISIMSSLKASWKFFRELAYNLQSSDNHFRVMDARSAGLPLCIGLINIFRKINGLEQLQNFVGTGVLRIDGSFDGSSLEKQKKQAVLQIDAGTKFVNSGTCQHVFDLANLMNC